jgi:hypothetical protein
LHSRARQMLMLCARGTEFVKLLLHLGPSALRLPLPGLAQMAGQQSPPTRVMLLLLLLALCTIRCNAGAFGSSAACAQRPDKSVCSTRTGAATSSRLLILSAFAVTAAAQQCNIAHHHHCLLPTLFDDLGPQHRFSNMLRYLTCCILLLLWPQLPAAH